MTALHGRVAIVSGGARGIGAAIVRDFVARGARVVVVDNGATIDGRSYEPAAVAAFTATFAEDQVVALTRGIEAAGAAEDAVTLAHDRFGGIDIAVHAAAIMRDAFVFKGNRDDFAAVVQANLAGGYALVAAVAPRLRENAKHARGGEPYAWGRLVMLVSTAALYGNYGQSAYAASKGGLVALSRVAALDLARAGVTANAVAPFAATRVTESIVPQTEAQAAYKATALTIPAEPVARFVSFLCTPRAAAITGQLFGVRGADTFVFSQPRPVARVAVTGDDLDRLGDAVERELMPHAVALESDLDAFAGLPVQQ